MRPRPTSLLPRGLYGRAALILILPIVTIQLIVSIGFIQRHFEGVTRQLTYGVVVDVHHLMAEIAPARTPSGAQARATEIAAALEMSVQVPAADILSPADRRDWYDLSGRAIIETLRGGLPALISVDLQSQRQQVQFWVGTAQGPLAVTVERRRMSASNPHQLLVLMIFASLIMTLIAYQFLRNQLRPIKKLADAAEAFGKGRTEPYRPRGALEVRAAGTAFLDMRARIERQIDQRTLMLSGVSHDLRTPLTRMRLGLSLLPEDEETRALLADVAQMERLVDEFLSFARGDAMEQVETVDPQALVARVVEDARRMGQPVTLARTDGRGGARLRPQAVTRALENLIGNAVRYGTRAEVSVMVTDRTVRLTVEDDGPGIAKARREEAMTPFARLEASRDPNRGGGVGLGLAIAADIARSHGGSLTLGASDTLGGLRADIVLAR